MRGEHSLGSTGVCSTLLCALRHHCGIAWTFTPAGAAAAAASSALQQLGPRSAGCMHRGSVRPHTRLPRRCCAAAPSPHTRCAGECGSQWWRAVRGARRRQQSRHDTRHSSAARCSHGLLSIGACVSLPCSLDRIRRPCACHCEVGRAEERAVVSTRILPLCAVCTRTLCYMRAG